MNNKIVIFRIVTSNYCVSTHLKNTLLRVPDNLQFVVIGENVEIFSVDYPLIYFRNIPLKRKFNLLYDIISFIKIAYLIFIFKPKVVHSLMTKSGLYSAIISYILRVNTRVHTFTGQIWANRVGFSKILLKTVDKIICKLNTHCFTDSKSQSEFLFENGISINKNLIPYFLNGSISGVDIHKYKYNNLISERQYLLNKLNIDDSQFILGYIARKSVDKGCIDMLKIFSQILNKANNNRIKLLFIGPDESNGLLSKYFKSNHSLRDNIIDLGFVNNHYNYLSICNLMCLPSHREGFGSIVIDAAAMGVPTIGYKIPGLIDSIADNYSGKLVPFGNMELFTEIVVDFINNSTKLKNFSINARKYIEEKFDADLVNQEMFNFYINGR
jgi:glycosyltransferase involved in cell wall biosynthesis